jgi:hypothetical protein
MTKEQLPLEQIHSSAIIDTDLKMAVAIVDACFDECTPLVCYQHAGSRTE